MNNMEMPIFFGGIEYKAFLQPGFFDDRILTPFLHSHRMTEIHLQLEGEVCYELDDSKIELEPNTLLVIPAGKFHRATAKNENVRRIAFQTSLAADSVIKEVFPKGSFDKLWENVSEALKSDNCDKLSAWLSAVCVEVLPAKKTCKIQPVRDREFIIHEFFSRRYSENLTLSTLAKELNLSEKQTERIVEKIFKMTFGQVLINHRMEVASKLISENKMSLAEIAEEVGYRSYSGFWKAYKQFYGIKE